MPEGIENVVIGEGVQQYKNLHDLEKRLDSAIVRKRLDIQDSISRTAKKYRTMRIWISNTVENQPWQGEGEGGTSNPGSGRYKVKIEGRLLDDGEEGESMGLDDEEGEGEGEGENGRKEEGGNAGSGEGEAMEQDGEKKDMEKEDKTSKRSKQRFSHFFKAINFDFDKSSAIPPEEIRPVNWAKPQLAPNVGSLPPSADFDSLQFTRSSQDNLNVTVSLVRDETPERYKLSKELAEVLDVEEETRSGIVLGLWDYIRVMGLQGDEEKRLVRCDHRLRTVSFPFFTIHPSHLTTDQIFGRDQIFFPQIPDTIGPHTSPMEPIKLPYTIRVDEEFHKEPVPTIYNIQVAVEDPLRAKMMALTQNPQYTAGMRQITALDDQVALIIQALTHSRAKHSFYTALSNDPVTFVRRWVSSQRRDLETILGEGQRGGGEDGNGSEFRRGGEDSAWDTPVAREAIRYLLAKPEAAAAR